ncbi:putative cytokinetic ring protein SteA [Litorihabitans aurantiacus]|uniref:Thiamin pyrophosphokinase n=1 Tax=Litorihabitans aurantiacus TaxID=1930061 RepID=A0AA38CTA4_9MICO|nr:putative cytokinetic ring protein SteA [Litorihabitans aurantiacus]GMA31647.1 thiamin pyrophosphokinase [Litorihabitans aurantiacus]
MRLRPLRRAAVADDPDGTISGPARVDPRTKALTKRLKAGDVAVIDHLDMDRVSAEALVACAPAAVLNAARSTSGRYPNVGPQILLDAGIPLVDGLGQDVMALKEGARLTVHDGEVRSGTTVVATGVLQDAATIEADQAKAREGLSDQLEAFAQNTMDYMLKERDLLLDGIGVPRVETKIEGRAVLIVVRGYHYKEDLAMLRSFIRESRPVLIGVDGGADAIIEAGWKPDLIVGDMDSVSDSALTSGAEVVVHAYRDGRAPGAARVAELGATHVVFPATGTSEDVAMLLADDMGAKLIVAVGTHATLVEFLDKGRSGMASTFLTRLRVGSKLVDAKGVSRLYRSTISTWQLVVLILAGLAALAVALAVTPAGQAALELLLARWDDISTTIRRFFGG